jgi:TRAP-type mannitol/chloroaromatic compound transport system permease large subunit
VLPVVLIGLILGSIISGWATPTQAGSIGAAGAFILMIINRSVNWARMHEVVIETGMITAMVFFVIIGANAFSFMFRILGGDDLLPNFLELLHLGDWGSLMFILSVIFVLGFFIDWIEIVLITLPIFYPVISDFDFSAHVGGPLLTRVWIGVAIAIVLQTSFLTPPFGFALFFLRGSAPPEVHMVEIYRGAVPLVAIQIAILAAVLILPLLATEIPSMFLD